MNNAEDTTVTIAVAPGDGRVARRQTVVLFDPTGNNDELITAFDDALTDGDAAAAVKQRLVGSEFTLSPISMISWGHGELDLMVWGDVAVHSSVPAAPMITGAGSASWVERRLGALELGGVADVSLWCGDEVDEATDLRLGVVRSGGVRVALVGPVADEPDADAAVGEHAHEQPGFVAAPNDLGPSESAGNSSAVELGTGVGSTSELAAPAVADRTATEPEPEPVTAAPPPSAPAIPDPFNAEPPTDAATSVVAPPMAPPVMPPPPAQETSSAPPASAFDDSDLTDAGSLGDEPMARGVGLVEALVCAQGHTNRPHSTACATCGDPIGVDAPAVLVEQPTVGQLVFLDGQRVEVSGALVLGRRPTVEAGAAGTVAIDQAEVSRSHASIAVEGWSAFVTDLESRNGTFVCPPDNPTPVRLEAGVQHLLEVGTTVHLGGSDASFTFVANQSG